MSVLCKQENANCYITTVLEQWTSDFFLASFFFYLICGDSQPLYFPSCLLFSSFSHPLNLFFSFLISWRHLIMVSLTSSEMDERFPSAFVNKPCCIKYSLFVYVQFFFCGFDQTRWFLNFILHFKNKSWIFQLILTDRNLTTILIFNVKVLYY